jgi:membrane-associated protease RseP (regulator of RpoE activity)
VVFVELLFAFFAPGLMLALAYAGGRLAARALGIPDFRLLRPAPSGVGWKRFGVRGASVVAAFVGCLLLGIVATINVGRQAPTTTVIVSDGPARYAGMRDGDRVVSIDGKPCTSWESLRADVRSSPEPKTIVVDPPPHVDRRAKRAFRTGRDSQNRGT